jgi:hypothetical protein
MQSPSRGTQEGDVDKLYNSISTLEKDIMSMRTVVEATKEQNVRLWQDTKKALEIKERELAFYRTHLDLIEKDRYIGLVQNAKLGHGNYFLSCPWQDKLEHVMDVALITMNLDQPWALPLMESAHEPKIREGTSYYCWEGDYLGNPNDTENHIKVVAKLGKGVYRMGVVSEFVAIIFYGGDWRPAFTRAIVQPPQYELADGTGTANIDLEKIERAIIEAWETGSADHESDIDSWDTETSDPIFCEPGDSGAFVIAAADFKYGAYNNRVAMPSTEFFSYASIAAGMPFLVGMLWGHSQRGNLSWIIPFEAVKQEIESLTGEEMAWPQKRTEYLKELEKLRLDD